MTKLRRVASVAVALLIAIALPSLCFAVPVVSVPVSGMPSGCHGHQLPAGSHNCCFVRHSVPGAVQVNIAPIVFQVTLCAAPSPCASVEQQYTGGVSFTSASPPPQVALRI